MRFFFNLLFKIVIVLLDVNIHVHTLANDNEKCVMN